MTYDEFCSHCNVSRETFERLATYANEVTRWQTKLNLVSPTTVESIWQRHILDSVQLVPLMPNNSSMFVDLGSGAGFPGLVLNILTGINTVLVESDQRKAIFLSEIIRQMDLNASVSNCRIESLSLSPVSLITARACAPLQQLCEWSAPLLSPDGVCLFPKGRNYRKEIDAAKKAWRFEVAITPSQTDPEAAMLAISNLSHRKQS